jgi:NADPH:quinone reductase-like Zn-dependent oxidoreductase
MGKQLAARVTSLDKSKIEDGYKNIEVQEIDVPEPNEGQALIKMILRPINPTDLLSSSGAYPGIADRIPFVQGIEGFGTIVKSASGKFAEGQRVVSAGKWNGTWQEYALADESSLLAVPDGLADDVAAQFYVNPTTVVGLVDAADVPKGGYLLQAAAGSALGRQLIQYAKHKGIKTINVVRRQEQVQQLKDLGADHVINQKEEDVVQRVMEITDGKGAYAALDPVAGDFTSTLLKAVRQWGTVLIYGALGGGHVSFQLMDVLISGRAARGFILAAWLHKDGPEKARERLDLNMQLLADGVMTPPKATETYPLSDLHEAIAAHQKAGRDGKVFLK